jgi:phosphoglycolate phosphatase-like HAD superfamily hydrolase
MHELLKIKQKIDKCKLLIFDFDGVLVDSVEVKTDAFASLYDSYGLQIVKKVRDHQKNNGGMSRFEKFKYYHQNFLNQEVSQEIVDNLSKKFSKLVFDKVVSSSEIKFSTEFLKKYSKSNKILAINSATPELELKKIVRARGLNDYFSHILGSPASKLDNIFKILKICKFSKDDAIFFGDSNSDIDAAINAKIDFIGVGNIIKRDERITNMNYSCIEDFKQIMEI